MPRSLLLSCLEYALRGFAVSIVGCCAACSETAFFFEDGGIRWAAAQTCLRDIVPQTPFFASRRSDAVGQAPSLPPEGLFSSRVQWTIQADEKPKVGCRSNRRESSSIRGAQPHLCLRT